MIRYTKTYIKDLLDKYMDGTSTLEEEDILADYLRTYLRSGRTIACYSRRSRR